MSRKTFDVAKFRNLVNNALAGDNNTPDHREAMASLLEHVLQETGNYHGFGYLEQKPMDNTNDIDVGDETRRVYYA